MRLDRRGDELAHSNVDRLGRDLSGGGSDDLHKVPIVAFDDGGYERLLARIVLVERANAHPRLAGDPVGAGPIEAIPHQNASGRLDQGVDPRARSLLRGAVPRMGWRPVRPLSASQ